MCQRNDLEIELSDIEMQLNSEIEKIMTQRLIINKKCKELIAKPQTSERDIAILSLQIQNNNRLLKAKIIRKFVFIIR